MGQLVIWAVRLLLVTSTLLLVGIVVLWRASHRENAEHTVAGFSTGSTRYGLVAASGKARLTAVENWPEAWRFCVPGLTWEGRPERLRLGELHPDNARQPKNWLDVAVTRHAVKADSIADDPQGLRRHERSFAATEVRVSFALLATLVAIPLVLWTLGKLAARHRRVRRGGCLHCGHALEGLRSGPCPGCGKGVNSPAKSFFARHPALVVAATGSFALAIAGTCFWWRSHDHADRFILYGRLRAPYPYPEYAVLTSAAGGVMLRWERNVDSSWPAYETSLVERRYGSPAVVRLASGMASSSWHYEHADPAVVERAGFLLMAYRPWGRTGPKYHVVVAPWWAVIAVTSALPALMLATLARSVLRERRRARRRLCTACGYDLRGSRGTCPECGAHFAPTAQSASEGAGALENGVKVD